MGNNNDKNLMITNEIFSGDAGKQAAYFREMFEILLLERKGVEINPTQQREIDRRIYMSEHINRVICNKLNITPLEDIEDVPEDPVIIYSKEE